MILKVRRVKIGDYQAFRKAVLEGFDILRSDGIEGIVYFGKKQPAKNVKGYTITDVTPAGYGPA